ncbi:MAG: phosphatidylserine decarboxylase [Candidatus Poseidoniaceae archaeon]|jgi:phosphatidylserine decarboxylase|nr:phosphatidylserine decarboxylase [Candidatus Poseidoniaceae archaeon]MDP7202679.1 phosphatidylserine decarboxylase [Candidatus Poseidoniaceae archaeon]
MGLFARGGTTPVVLSSVMGIASLLIATFVDPVMHLVTLTGVLCLMFSAFLANFFRDPDRPVPKDVGVLVSPADGHVMFVVREHSTGRRPSKMELESGECENDSLTGDWFPEPLSTPLSFDTEQRWEKVVVGQESNEDVWRVAVFMSPLDVHVNRVPEAGTIIKMEHRTGKGRRKGPFLPAFKKESEYNERVRTQFKSDNGEVLEITQISGALARTIIPWKREGDVLRRGERYGMIRVGSRVDLRVPAAIYEPMVIGADSKNPSYPKGQFVSAAVSILFRSINSAEEE